MEQLLEFGLRITPGIVLIVLTYLLLPKKSIVSKLFLLLFGFILMRDAMTPLGFWQFGISQNTMWLRFIDDGLILFALALTSLVVTFGIVVMNKPLNKHILWFGTNKVISLMVGLVGAVIVIAPFFIMYINAPIEGRGGIVSLDLLLPLFAIVFDRAYFPRYDGNESWGGSSAIHFI